MEYIIVLFLLILIYKFLFHSMPKIHKTNNSVLDNISLMPFEMVTGIEAEKVKYSWNPNYFDKEIFGKGYINTETFEIVIPAQYDRAANFVGNFAVIQKGKIVGKKKIINKANEIVLSGFDEAALYQSEHGNTVFALIRNDSRRRFFKVDPVNMFDFFPFSIYPTRNVYRLYNLSAGLLLKKEKKEQYKWFRSDPEIFFTDKYLIYDNVVYEILENGKITERTLKKEDLFNIIIESRNLQKKEYGFHFNSELSFDPHFWYMEMLDIDLLIQNIPGNMLLRNRASESDGWFKDSKPVYDINPINRILTYPLKINNLLYEVQLAGIGEEDREGYIGLYNSSENNWAIPPVKRDILRGFIQTEYVDWVIYNVFFYNIKTRKKYITMFSLDEGNLTYYGYQEKYKEEGEDF